MSPNAPTNHYTNMYFIVDHESVMNGTYSAEAMVDLVERELCGSFNVMFCQVQPVICSNRGNMPPRD